jgi:hypothetical protein
MNTDARPPIVCCPGPGRSRERPGVVVAFRGSPAFGRRLVLAWLGGSPWLALDVLSDLLALPAAETVNLEDSKDQVAG